MSEFLFHPVLGWGWLILLAVLIGAGAGLTFFYGLRSRWRIGLLWALRVLALVALVVVLGQPQRRREQVTVLRPQLAVLVDTSESMSDPVDEKQPVRGEMVKRWFASPAFTNQLADFDVRVFTFDGAVNEAGKEAGKLQFRGDRTDLLGALRQTQDRFRGQPLAAICLLSDGLDTISGLPVEKVSAPTTAPVFAFELEKPFVAKPRAKEIGITHVDYPSRVMSGWDAEVKVSVHGTAMAGEAVVVELWRDGRKQQEQAVSFSEDVQTREAVFTLTHEKPGPVQYEARVADPAAKGDSAKAPFVIDVIEPGNRVLYVQNSLSFDFKFLRRAIEGNRNLELAAFVRWKDGRLVSLTQRGAMAEGAALSFAPASLGRYAVVIIGNLPADSLSAADYNGLRDFVDKGGGLVVLGGSESLLGPGINATPLKEVMPVTFAGKMDYREGQYPVAITDTGLHHPVFGPLFAKVNEFPPLQTINRVEGTTPLAEVLIRADMAGRKVPLVTATWFGKGRVLVVATDTLFGWRLAEKGWTQKISPYDTFWAQLMDWLIPKEQEKGGGNKLEVFTERTNYLVGEKPEVRAIVTSAEGGKTAAQLPLRVKTPEEKSFEYTMSGAMLPAAGGKQVPGYRATVDLTVPGVYVAEATALVGGTNVTAQARFIVTKPPTELTGKPVNRDMLSKLTETSHGRFCRVEEWNDWRKELHVEEQHFSTVQLIDLWNHPVLLGILLALLAGEWIIRKLWSLP